MLFFFFKQKTAYEMRISDWSSDLCSSDLVERGQVLAKPGSITPHTYFEAEVYVLSKDEGGRHTPFFKGYRPQFYFRTTDITGAVTLPEGTEMVMPGDNVKMAVTLINPVDRKSTRLNSSH